MVTQSVSAVAGNFTPLGTTCLAAVHRLATYAGVLPNWKALTSRWSVRPSG
ncbi:hypothetical protein [Rubripirellula reticaptiva]|uniref:hypothetical protein n=1 Tax=Rubripirellula reticaptiva TaxID=2528013 RepID=UPI001644C0A4|nr:hypothetical protein [Rubripirellula reticaptiva]